jgi:hypothetical protein
LCGILKFDRQSNDASAQEGKGYLLVLNSKTQEVKLPGVLSESRFFDENGHYLDKENPALKDFLKGQRDLFACYAYYAYATYINGEAPTSCADEWKDHLQSVTFDGRPLRYRRERFNDYLPYQQYKTEAVDQAYRNYAGMRTGLSPFNPPEAGEFSPFKVYKEFAGEMVLDQSLTDTSSNKFSPVSKFSDKDNAFSSYKRFQGDSVVVEKKGLEFQVASPSARVLSEYSKSTDGEANENWARRPRVKVYFDWTHQR